MLFLPLRIPEILSNVVDEEVQDHAAALIPSTKRRPEVLDKCQRLQFSRFLQHNEARPAPQ